MRVTLSQAAAAFRQKARMIERRAKEAEAASAKEALGIARGMSSGPLSARTLAVMGHPYARTHPSPPFSAAIINISGVAGHSGRFRAAWRTQNGGTAGGGIRSLIVNDSPEAQFLTERPGPRSRMIGRPIIRAIAGRLRGLRQRRLAAAVRAGLKV